jgi:hypothetical protein
MTKQKQKKVPGSGRRKEFHIRITLPLTAAMLEQIDAARNPYVETRVDFIRRAIERELRFRAKQRR